MYGNIPFGRFCPYTAQIYTQPTSDQKSMKLKNLSVHDQYLAELGFSSLKSEIHFFLMSCSFTTV